MTSSPLYLMNALLTTFRSRWRPLLTYHLFFVLLTATLLIPLASFLLTQLLSRTGHPVVSNEALYQFVFSLPGIIWLLLAGTLALTLAFIQVCGLLLVLEVHGRNRYQAVTAAIVATVRQVPKLIRLALVQVAAHLVLAMPILLVIFGLAYWLLSDFDPYYLLHHWPSEKRWFIALSIPLLLIMATANGALYVRWVLALPLMVFERTGVQASLQRSQQLTRNYRMAIAFTLLGVAASTLILPIAFSLLYRELALVLLDLASQHLQWLIGLTVILLMVYLVVSVMLSFVVVVANGLVIRFLYLRACGIRATRPPPLRRRLSGLLAWGTELTLLVFVAAQALWLVHGFFEPRDEVAVSAHRGSSVNAPENTLAAIELAIDEGADYIEVDVQRTVDGGLILAHDRDFRRMGGPATPIWELSLEQARAIDVGTWFDPAFSDQRPPTLQETIDVVRGRASLYLEIKPGPNTQGLVADVIAVLQAEGMMADTVLAALNRSSLEEARSLAPELRRSLFVHTVVGTPDYRGLDAVGFRAATVSRDTVIRAREAGHDIHVWTVNDPAEMSRFIDLGVDNIITDRPDVLVSLLAERAELSAGELLLVRVNNWLR